MNVKKLTRISVNNFCLADGNILIYCHPQDTTTNCGEQTMVPHLGVNRYLVCIYTKWKISSIYCRWTTIIMTRENMAERNNGDPST